MGHGHGVIPLYYILHKSILWVSENLQQLLEGVSYCSRLWWDQDLNTYNSIFYILQCTFLFLGLQKIHDGCWKELAIVP
jgi:hypothetical protein